MPAEHIHPDVVGIALDRAEGYPFERFANAFYGALAGAAFAPLGGVKDGGADARDVALYEDRDRPQTYYQATVEADVVGKTRRTVARLREFGRDPRVLTLFTSRTVKYTDRVERELTDELDVTIHIRDAQYIALHVNTDQRTRLAFDEHLRHYTDYLRSVASTRLIQASKHVKSPAVYVFLANEVERRSGDESLIDSVTDALILWALEGTDPDKGILCTGEEITERIAAEIPSVKTLVEPRLARRLEAMSAKSYPGGRGIRCHRSESAYCLPWEVRRRIEEENTADEALRLRVLDSLDARLRTAPPAWMSDVGIRTAAEVSLRALQLAFEREGLEFASFLEGDGTGEYPTIFDALRQAVSEAGLTGKHGQQIQDGAFVILRGVLYESRADEREYLRRLSRTYALLFTLNTEPRLLEFFQDMTSDFRLYVGADQIVRALSEHYLEPADKMTHNTLLMTARLRAKVILTEPALEEVVNHLRGADNEYHSRVAGIEHRMTYELVREVPQIMLRAYLYARINPNLGRRQPKGWQSFINQFVNPASLHKSSAYDEMRQYLQQAFGMEFESTNDLLSLVDADEVDALADGLSPVKRDARLAWNDALIALAVYGRRQRRRETSRVTEFGWGTWWLTGETAIVRVTRDIVARHHGARYILRPDFLLNFLTLAPSAYEARKAFAGIFPSMLGIQLARRMSSSAYAEIMDRVAEAEQLGESRRTVEMSRLMNELKSDFNRGYPRTGKRTSAAVDNVAGRASTLGVQPAR